MKARPCYLRGILSPPGCWVFPAQSGVRARRAGAEQTLCGRGAEMGGRPLPSERSPSSAAAGAVGEGNAGRGTLGGEACFGQGGGSQRVSGIPELSCRFPGNTWMAHVFFTLSQGLTVVFPGTTWPVISH